MNTVQFRAVNFRMGVEGNRVVGHASVFNVLARIDNGYEEIAPSAFDGVLKERKEDVRLLLNHNPDHLLGRTQSGTLRLGLDAVGLTVDNDLPDTQLGRDVRILIQRGDLTGFSFGFMPDAASDTFRYAPDKRLITTRNNLLRLTDVSLVTYPAFDANDAALRSVNYRSNRDKLILAKWRVSHQKG